MESRYLCRYLWVTVGVTIYYGVSGRETHLNTYSPRGFEAAIHRYEQSACRPIHFIEKEYQLGVGWYQLGWAFLSGLLVGLLLVSTWQALSRKILWWSFKRTKTLVRPLVSKDRPAASQPLHPQMMAYVGQTVENSVTCEHTVECSASGEVSGAESSETLVVLEEVERVARALVDKSPTADQSLPLPYESLRHIGLGVVKIADDRKYQRDRLKQALENKEMYTKKLLHELQKAAEKDFQDLCLETILAGIIVMTLTLLWLANAGIIKESFIKTQYGRCGRLPLSSFVQGLNWFSFVVSAWCHLRGLGNAVSGLFLLFFAPYAMYRGGILNNFGRLTFLKLGFGLGLGCGAVGTVTVNSIGGHGWLWALVWVIWVTMHLILAATSRRICMADAKAKVESPLASYDGTDSRELSMLKTSMWMYLVLILPVLSAILPFYDELLYV